jgi:hypothetical protein
MTEFRAREKATYYELKRAKVHLEKIEKRLNAIDECLKYKFTQSHHAGGNREFIEQFYLWLHKVEAIGFKTINRTTAEYRKSFRNPTQREIQDGIDPTKAIASLRFSLENVKKILVKQRIAMINKLPSLEERAHRAKVDRLIVEYVRKGIELTNLSIRVAILVPIAILIIVLLGTVAWRTFKPEIVEWIRHLVRLEGMPK